ncbi:MAG TPA: hypothetical protein VLN61_11360 [Pseudolabrys sp.]|nr:hypothetical protein [Pseudolabrys sp.]
MSKALFAVGLVTGLIAAPFPPLTPTAASRAAQPAAPEKKQAKVKKPPTPV